METFVRHFWILLCRNSRLFIVDRTGLFLALVQAPVIALFIILSLYGSERDHKSSDEMMRKTCSYVKEVEKDRPNTEGMYEKYRIARAAEYLETMTEKEEVLSPHHAQARATIFFVMISASIWMGLLGSCKEIVTEWKVIHREYHSSFSPAAYVLSKLCVLGTVLLFQVFCMTMLTLGVLMHDTCSLGGMLCHFGVNWLTGFGACVIGLLMSGVIGSIRWALALVPMVMMPQILMGGLLRPPAQVLPDQRSVLRDLCSAMTLQRWAFEAELIIDTRLGQATEDGEIQAAHKVAVLGHDTKEKSLLYQLKCKTTPLDEYFFIGRGGGVAHRVCSPIVWLGVFAICLSLVTWLLLWLRLHLANIGFMRLA